METEVIQTLMQFFVGGLIIPIVGLLKKTILVGDTLRPEFVTGMLAIVVAFGLREWLNPAMTITEAVNLGLATAGVTSIMYGGKKVVKKPGGSK